MEFEQRGSGESERGDEGGSHAKIYVADTSLTLASSVVGKSRAVTYVLGQKITILRSQTSGPDHSIIKRLN